MNHPPPPSLSGLSQDVKRSGRRKTLGPVPSGLLFQFQVDHLVFWMDLDSQWSGIWREISLADTRTADRRRRPCLLTFQIDRAMVLAPHTTGNRKILNDDPISSNKNAFSLVVSTQTVAALCVRQTGGMEVLGFLARFGQERDEAVVQGLFVKT
jgi:hypothetical protein